MGPLRGLRHGPLRGLRPLRPWRVVNDLADCVKCTDKTKSELRESVDKCTVLKPKSNRNLLSARIWHRQAYCTPTLAFSKHNTSSAVSRFSSSRPHTHSTRRQLPSFLPAM